HLRREARHRLLVVRGGEPGQQMAVSGADFEIGTDGLGHVGWRPDGLACPQRGAAIALEQLLEDTLGLGPGVPYHHGADDGRAFDLTMIAAHGAAVLLENRFLPADGVHPAADVARVSI